MRLLDNMLANYIDILGRYIKNWPLRLGTERILCKAKHTSASELLDKLKIFIESCQELSSEEGTIEGFNSDSPDIIAPVPVAITNQALSSPITPAAANPPSAASSKSSGRYHSLLYYELKKAAKLKAAVKVAPSPGIVSSVSAAGTSEERFSEYRHNNNISCAVTEFQDINHFLMLEQLFVAEQTKIADLRRVTNNHPEGSYDALLALIIANIRQMHVMYLDINADLTAKFGYDFFDLETIIDRHRLNLIFLIAEFNCMIAYDCALYKHNNFRGNKSVYALNGNISARKSEFMQINSELGNIARHIFNTGYIAEYQYAKTIADYLAIKQQVQKLVGISPRFIEGIDKEMRDLADNFAEIFVGRSLPNMVLEYMDSKKPKKPFFLDTACVVSGDESPFAPPPRAVATPGF
jgi:hypothetical protein